MDPAFTPRKRGKEQKQPLDRLVDICLAILVVLIIAAVTYPIWFIIVASVSSPRAVATGQVTLLPQGLGLAGYELILGDARIWTGYKNTIIYAVVGTAINLLVTLPAAFAMSRREFRPRRIIMFLFAFTMFFGGGLIPSFLLVKDLGLLNTMWVFVLPGAFSVFNMIIARSFFESSIPEEMYDAAQIDGLTYFGYFTKIVLPLSGAIIAVIGLYYFVGHWNNFFTGLIYIREQNLLPLQNVLQQILMANQSAGQVGGSAGTGAGEAQEFADQIKFGVIIVSSLPLMILYPLLQRFFDKGVMIGAVKG
ncbi:carbohydrate ABC transporter permease [Tessaracoccus caeni]|uniref:carbohydrate ABC transporter permease n=1 Tax=Tessaracoccus caeni TaxID=3031239 RepID=UPI0023DA5BE0|nr:carbohydrate ABC transporter permease [Tessaracoccus caeni]MDF1489631.1 carbohydrate ABC transporter permease [Tessaracoccus caeni]